MKTFKTIDCYIQGFIFFAALSAWIVYGRDVVKGEFFSLYFVMGGWQVLSMMVHWGYDDIYKIDGRRIYEITLAATAIVGIISLFGFFLEFLIGLLMWSPVLALIYFTCCCIETSRLDKVRKAQTASEVDL
jgi:hypothetical protein